jgi:hypothetical protein
VIITVAAAEAQLPTANAHALQRHALLGLECVCSLLSQALLILEQGHHLLDLLTHIDSLVFAITINVLEVLECLDGVEVLPALVGYTLGACLQQVIQ